MRRHNISKVAKVGFILVVTLVASLTIISVHHQNLGNFTQSKSLPAVEVSDLEHDPFENFKLTSNANGNWRQLTNTQIKTLSKLGRILFLDEEIPLINQTAKKYKILVWKYGPTTHNRHIKRYSDKEYDPFEFCSVKNCDLTYDSNSLASADIVITHLHRSQGVNDLPPVKDRNENQIWAFSTDESPHHTFMNGKQSLSKYNGFFNWSMTYRMDSDIPVPYGRAILRPHIDPEYKFDLYPWLLTKKHDVFVTIMGSNCGSKNHRWEYVNELKKYIKVDTYGACGTLKCPGHFKKDCPEISNYIFYLSFENSNCDEYVTEKIWWNAYAKKSIPIVMGGTKNTYKNLIPPHSYIDVDNFASPRDLATYLTYLTNTPSELRRFFQWKKYFRVVNEHGYFQSVSYHYCRVCEALNYNSREKKVYKDLDTFWNVKKDCIPAWDSIQNE